MLRAFIVKIIRPNVRLMSTRRPTIVSEEQTLENLKVSMEREMNKFQNQDLLAAA